LMFHAPPRTQWDISRVLIESLTVRALGGRAKLPQTWIWMTGFEQGERNRKWMTGFKRGITHRRNPTTGVELATVL
jgi:hypothetical protein